MPDRCAALIVGAGPAGLAAALQLKRQGVSDVVVVDREDEAGGVPRLCGHTGFGIRDLHRVYTGPGYARHYRQQAEAAGVDVRTSTTVTGWSGSTTVTVTSPKGLGEIQAQAVLLATGCYERPRAGRLVHGRRPHGVFTTGSLQRFVYEHGEAVGRRAVIAGAETVSLSTLLTLGHAHCAGVALVTEYPSHQIPFLYLPVKWAITDLRGVSVIARSRVQRILGERRVEAVELTHVETGETQALACDTVIFTGSWMPESDLARLARVALDGATRAPQADAALRTAVPGVFAAGNLLRGALGADLVALEGRAAGRQIATYLLDGKWPTSRLALQAGRQVAWVSPNAVSSPCAAPPLGAFLFQASAFARQVQATISQGDRVLHRQVFGRLVPNQPARLSAGWVAQVDPAGPALRLDVG